MWAFWETSSSGCSPCRLQPATVSSAGFSATPWGKSIRKLLKLGKRSPSACMSVRCPAELGLPHHTHTRACKQLWQAHAEKHSSTAAKAHFDTHTHTPSTLSLGSSVLVLHSAGSRRESQCVSFFLPFFFPCYSLLFFQAAITARTRHLFTMLRNTTLPLAAGVFTRWRKLSIGIEKRKKKVTS